MILAGGFGTRLRPFTYRYPKSMIPIKRKPFLEYLIRFLKRQGKCEIILCLHHMADKIIEYFGDGSKFGVHIKYSVEKTPLGTGGAIKHAERYLDNTFFVLNGDTYLDIDLREILDYHKNKGGIGTIALVKTSNLERYGAVRISESGRLIGFFEKALMTKEGHVNAGVYVFERKILDHIPRDVNISLEREIIPELLKSEEICGFLSAGYFIDIGMPEDYSKFQRDVKKVFSGDF